MSNLWENGKIVKAKQIRRVYKKCPECGKDYALFHKEGSFNLFKCLGCEHIWKEKR